MAKKVAGRQQSITHEQFNQLLLDLPPMELKGVALLRQFRATGVMPTDKEQVTEATRQLVTYTSACEAMARSLQSLPPVPAEESALVEGFPL